MANVPNSKLNDLGSAEVKIQQAIRWKVEDPYLFLNMGGMAQVERTIIAYSESITRAIASRVELDPLIALKLEVGQQIHQCFQKGREGEEQCPVETEIKPWSVYVGIVFILLLAILPFTILTSMDVFPSICMILFAIGFGGAGVTVIAHQHIGIYTILGKRTHVYASEGYQWAPWPFMGYTSVDMREHLIELKTEDRVIKVIAGNAEGAGATIPENISEQIDRSFRNDSGVNVLEVLCSEILPTNLEILRAREALAVETARSDAQDEDMGRQGTRAASLRKKLPGLPPLEALRAVQAQEGDLDRDEMIVTANGGVESLVGLIASTLKRFGVQTKEGGGRQGNNKRNRNRDNQTQGKKEKNP
ncbi:MAG: hypothetical protein Q7R72_02085 [bacterium]|nr:hypothetical protein [bacterium]